MWRARLVRCSEITVRRMMAGRCFVRAAKRVRRESRGIRVIAAIREIRVRRLRSEIRAMYESRAIRARQPPRVMLETTEILVIRLGGRSGRTGVDRVAGRVADRARPVRVRVGGSVRLTEINAIRVMCESRETRETRETRVIVERRVASQPASRPATWLVNLVEMWLVNQLVR